MILRAYVVVSGYGSDYDWNLPPACWIVSIVSRRSRVERAKRSRKSKPAHPPWIFTSTRTRKIAPQKARKIIPQITICFVTLGAIVSYR